MREDETLDKRIHVGATWFASVKYPFRRINLRKFFNASKHSQVIDMKPTSFGVSFKPSEWNSLKVAMQKTDSERPDIAQLQRCIFNDDRHNRKVKGSR